MKVQKIPFCIWNCGKTRESLEVIQVALCYDFIFQMSIFGELLETGNYLFECEAQLRKRKRKFRIRRIRRIRRSVSWRGFASVFAGSWWCNQCPWFENQEYTFPAGLSGTSYLVRKSFHAFTVHGTHQDQQLLARNTPQTPSLAHRTTYQWRWATLIFIRFYTYFACARRAKNLRIRRICVYGPSVPVWRSDAAKYDRNRTKLSFYGCTRIRVRRRNPIHGSVNMCLSQLSRLLRFIWEVQDLLNDPFASALDTASLAIPLSRMRPRLWIYPHHWSRPRSGEWRLWVL